MTFRDLGLMPSLLKSVSEKGFSQPSPIQQKAIPFILEGKDLLGGAQTGTGKTAAFALPVLQLLEKQNNREHYPRALVLTPTRELAEQVHRSFIDFGSQLHQRCAALYGGVNINPQIQQIGHGVDVLVACPGRLLDLVNRGHLDLSRIKFLILDEADRMLDMGFLHDIRKLISLLPSQRQNLLFSATYSDSIRKFACNILKQPILVEVSKKNEAAHQVAQSVCHVAADQKKNMLIKLIRSEHRAQALVFTRTKHGANKLAQHLDKQGIDADAFHSNKSQSARTNSLNRFKNNHIQVLVATDIAARGIDIEKLPWVINFDLPNVPEDYVHRIGRTGRAGETGRAVSLVTPDDIHLLRQVEKLLGNSIDRNNSAEPIPSDESQTTVPPSDPIPFHHRKHRSKKNTTDRFKRRRRTTRSTATQQSA
ncbi:MAG: DEAD/DEAH box helicase [Deltaproteobacteria bacterium]|nr:DEAD/DEAH box helicase [Deltaproteobacteria bacterium]MBN2672568.1 DEAD/DEAH box helicase [Deltaproteobacteria bacterium]